MAGFLIAILSGALMSIQGVFNTGVTKSSSIWVAAGFVQITAFLTCAVMLLLKESRFLPRRQLNSSRHTIALLAHICRK